MRRIDLTLPKGWNDLNQSQLYIISRNFHKKKGDNYLLTKCFLELTGLKMKKGIGISEEETIFTFTKKGETPFEIGLNTFTPMVQKLDWILKEIEPLKFIPDLGKKAINYKLVNVCLEDYLLMDTNFRAFSYTGKKRYLYKFLAVAYNRKRFWLRLEPMYKKQAALFWFAGVKKLLRNMYPFIWPGQSNETSTPVSDQEVVLSLLSSLNNGDITKNKEILKTHLHEAFYQLNLAAQQVKK